jgi:hypothetical protein
MMLGPLGNRLIIDRPLVRVQPPPRVPHLFHVCMSFWVHPRVLEST